MVTSVVVMMVLFVMIIGLARLKSVSAHHPESKFGRCSYRCPFGTSVINAATLEELERKVRNHNIYAHGVAPIIFCGKPQQR